MIDKPYITVRIYHGSQRKWKSRKDFKEVGGLMGGHVAIQVEDHVYGFFYKDLKKLHIFPTNKNKNCEFQKQTLEEWNEIIKLKKETTIKIPVTNEDIEFLLGFYETNLTAPSCDYSFFGERCASNCYHLLKKIGKITGGSYFLNAFWPGQLIRKLKRESKKHGYEINVKQGDPNRIWQ